MTENAQPTLLLTVSPILRESPRSPFMRVMRDFAFSALQRYRIVATGRTADCLLRSGLFTRGSVSGCRMGSQGGLTELAAYVARGEARVAVLLHDPGDPWTDSTQNWALRRLCIARGVRLLTTVQALSDWLESESHDTVAYLADPDSWHPPGWRVGQQNVLNGKNRRLNLDEQTIALVSHDEKKRDMVSFVARFHDTLRRFDRILTTARSCSPGLGPHNEPHPA